MICRSEFRHTLNVQIRMLMIPNGIKENVLYKQEPIALGYSLITPIGKTYDSKVGGSCVTRFVDQMLVLQVTASEYFTRNIF